MLRPAPSSKHRSLRRRVRYTGIAVLGALQALAGSDRLGAQAPSVDQDQPPLQGIVADQDTGQPIAAATLSLIGLDLERRTDATGRFAFPDTPMGPVTIRAQAPGYVTMVEEVDVSTEAIAFVQFFLPELSSALGELFVEVEGARPSTALEAGTAADLLARRVLGMRPRTGVVGDTDYTVLLRGVSSFTNIGEPAIFIDGVRVSGGMRGALDVLIHLPASDVEDIRILRGPASANHVFGADGAIYVETRTGPEN